MKNKVTYFRRWFPAGIFLAGLGSAYAQTAPDAGTLLRETEKSLEQPRLPAFVPLPPAKAPVETAPAGVTVAVKGFRLKGVTLVPEADLYMILEAWVGKSLSFSELRKAADAVAEAYRAKGFLVRAFLPEQDLADGIVSIVVIEGRLGAVRVDRVADAGHLGEETVRQYMLSRQDLGDPVRPDDLQRAISLLNDLPGVSASSVLEPGQREGESLVAVSLRDTPGFTGMAQIDNTGAKTTGETRLTVSGNINSPLRIGDQIQVIANKSQGATFGRAAYSLPVGSDGLRVGVVTSDLSYNYRLTGVGYTGNAKDHGLTLNYPIRRGNDWNLAVAATFDRKEFNNSVRAVELNNKSISVGSLVFSGDQLDAFLGGGLTQYSLGYASGTLDLSRNATDLAADQGVGGPNRQGGFSKVTWTLSRLQRLAATDALAISASGQIAGRNLDSAEKFAATGPSAVRAYSTTEASGDDANLVSVEWRHQFGDDFQGTVFYDTARVSRDHTVNVSTLSPNSFSLSGAGIGLNWGKATDLSIRAVMAWRLGSNPVRAVATDMDSDGTRRDPRVWLTLLRIF